MAVRAVRGVLTGLVLTAAGVVAPPLPAQDADGMAAAQILILDQERLFSDSKYGLRVQAELEKISNDLAERNQLISAELRAEEQELTERRSSLSPEEFRPLADAFDTKVVRLREEQDARIRELQRRRDQERRVFTQRVLPVLSNLAGEAGAVAILDERAVILSADRIDVTDQAIQRVDELLGDGGELAAPEPGEDLPPADNAPDPEAVDQLPGSPSPGVVVPLDARDQ
ncbi:OmpH family outer membrane protein [Tropicimonas isoalkanivorans]|uniref:Periplasmic chaperone for outer membrane proteins Skp n=1 Tax=Tropicimonas isoalkanivorans TaxID=441112 RepID=A0A1I1K7P9_9RHOB|nr:OmpH family outer membrane protein [Tropicimonas isoalkanivorans]SFC56312.1 periplasmic chaperone for outer membrane proteins Skp [Tropicimonas isoalkanivorans]